MKILDSILPVLGGGTLTSLSRAIGASPESTRRALGAIVPTSIGGLADFAADANHARSLLDRFRGGDYPRLDAADAEQALANPEIGQHLARSSEEWLRSIFGARQAAVMDAIADYAGISRAGTSRLFGLALPLVLGVVGKHALGSGLDARGLSRYLEQQKAMVASPIPPSTAARRPLEGPGDPRARLWALAGLAAMIGLGWWLARRPHPKEAAHVTASAPREPAAVKEASPPEGAPSEVSRAEIEPVAGQSAMLEMSSYLESKSTAPKRFVLEGLELETGTAKLTPEARKIGDDLAGLLRRHPEAKVQIIGPSGERAASLAQYLIDHGVGSDRIKAESRAANRRVEIVLQP